MMRRGPFISLISIQRPLLSTPSEPPYYPLKTSLLPPLCASPPQAGITPLWQAGVALIGAALLLLSLRAQVKLKDDYTGTGAGGGEDTRAIEKAV